MAESIDDIVNSPLVQLLTGLVTAGLISPQIAQFILDYLYDIFGDEIFTITVVD